MESIDEPISSPGRGRLAETWSAAKPWLSGLLLLLLLDLPSSVLLTLGLLLRRRKVGSRALTALAAVWVVLLALYRLDVAIFHSITRASPVLYDQLFMAKHLMVLVSDLWSPAMALGLAALVGGIVLAAFAVRAASRSWLSLANTRRVNVALVCAWLVAGAMTAWQVSHRPSVLVRWVSIELARNVRKSAALYDAVEQRLGTSTYEPLRKVELRSRPDVRLILVESYGRLMFSHPGLRRVWSPRAQELEQSLGAAGYSMVSAYGTASVSGGRSWIAAATLLTGIDIRYEGVFQHMLGKLAEQPTLVSVLSGMGYRTHALAPSNRERLGLHSANLYGYHEQVEFAHLDYHGAPWGWGLVPDQYSLEYFQTRVLARASGPIFADMRLVS
jgi:hypothetical protein